MTAATRRKSSSHEGREEHEVRKLKTSETFVAFVSFVVSQYFVAIRFQTLISSS